MLNTEWVLECPYVPRRNLVKPARVREILAFVCKRLPRHHAHTLWQLAGFAIKLQGLVDLLTWFEVNMQRPLTAGRHNRKHFQAPAGGAILIPARCNLNLSCQDKLFLVATSKFASPPRPRRQWQLKSFSTYRHPHLEIGHLQSGEIKFLGGVC